MNPTVDAGQVTLLECEMAMVWNRAVMEGTIKHVKQISLRLGATLALLLPVFGLAEAQTAASASSTASAASAVKPGESPCDNVGEVARQIATWRDRGGSAKLADFEIAQRIADPAARAAARSMVDELYRGAGRRMSPDIAARAYAATCASAGKKAGAEKPLHAPVNQTMLAPFKTFDGRPLIDILQSYGIAVVAVDRQAVGADPAMMGDQLGDVIWTLTLATAHVAPMPCHLERWVAPEGNSPGPDIEVVQRGAVFPLLRESDEDPLIFWAATGRCSTAFSW